MNSIGIELAAMYGRELDRLADEIAAYPSEADLWTTTGAQKNSPGVLAMHSVGAILGKIGADIGNTGYVRNRDLEFSGRNIPRDEIIRAIRECKEVIVPIIADLDENAMNAKYPGQAPASIPGCTTRMFLIHMLWHHGWHLGQIYYHRLGIATADHL